MALTVRQLINDALQELQDSEAVRWKRLEMLAYFNAAQRAFAAHRPDQMMGERVLSLTQGWLQQVPKDVETFMDVTNNVNQSQKRITKTDMWVLDAVSANWRSSAPGREVQHYMHDLRNPNEFLVFPPVQAGVKVRALVSASVRDLEDESEAASVPAVWMDSLRHFVLYRAWSKDAEFGGNAQLATAHFQLFLNALGVQSQAAAAMAPNA